MMLIMSVAVSCRRVIARSSSFQLRMLGAAEDSDTDLSDSDERQRDSTCLRPPQIYIKVSSSSSPPFAISLYLGLLTLIAASFPVWLGDILYNPISTAPLPVAGTTDIKTVCVSVCAITHQAECYFSCAYMSSHVKVVHMRKSSALRCFGATYFQLFGVLNTCKELKRLLSSLHLLIFPA